MRINSKSIVPLAVAAVLSVSCSQLGSEALPVIAPPTAGDFDTLAHFHNVVLSGLLASGTKDGREVDTSSPEHISLALDIAFEEAARMGRSDIPEDITSTVVDAQSTFFSRFSMLGPAVAAEYCELLPYPESVRKALSSCYMNDLVNGGNSFEAFLKELSDTGTKSMAEDSVYPYSKLYDFYLSDKSLEIRTKDKARHYIGVAVDVIVGAVFSGLSGFWGALAAGTIGALASETLERTEMKTETDPTNNCD